MQPQPTIPVFKSTMNLVTAPDDICRYVLDAYIRTPKGINDTFFEREVSLTHDIAKHIEKEALTSIVRENLRKVLINYFNDNQLTLEVDIVKSNNETISNVSIAITVFHEGRAYSVGNKVIIDQLGNIRVGK